MKKIKPGKDELRAEYDLRQLGPGVAGKYLQGATAGTNLVLLDPDVAKVFPDAESVNRALRLLMDVAAAGRPVVRQKASRVVKPRPASVAAKSSVPSRGSKKKTASRRS